MLTKICFQPWYLRMIHAGGMICPCCAMGDTDYGDFLLDYLEPKKRGIVTPDILNNPAIVDLKRGLLTGRLHPMCRKCALVPQEMIPIEEFKCMLEEKFEEWGVLYEKGTDYAEVNAVCEIGLGVTNRCNLRCIYCNQSVLADKNPYFKVDFPKDEIASCLEGFIVRGVKRLETGAFGEATIYPGWSKVFGAFHRKHPEIELILVTNLCKKYTEEEIELLAEHDHLCISLETLDAEKFAKIRVNGDLELLLKNLEMIRKVIDRKHYGRSRITISSVICNLTWQDIPQVSAFAFRYGYEYRVNNLEKRKNSIGVQEGLLQQVEELSEEERGQIREHLQNAQNYAKEHGNIMSVDAGLMERANRNYNLFQVYDNNPIYRAFSLKYPFGTADMQLSVEYDHLGQQHSGIKMKCGTELELAWQEPFNKIGRAHV